MYANKEINGKEKAKKIIILRTILILGGIALTTTGIILFNETFIFLIVPGALMLVIGVCILKEPQYCPHCSKVIEKHLYQLDPQDENRRILSCPFCKEKIKYEQITTEDDSSTGPCGISWCCWCLICGA